MIFSVNVDPTHSGGYADFGQVKALGFNGVALVSKPGVSHEYAWAAREAGLHVLARIDRDSNGHMIPADVYQIGNEPDHTSPSSWTMTPGEYIKLWQQYRNTYPDLTLIGAGLASGDPDWWVYVNRRIDGCAGVGVHPYAKNAAEARELLDRYAEILPSRPIWVTEWNRPGSQVQVFSGMLGGRCAYAAWFCWSDAMVPDMGLLSARGNMKFEADEISMANHDWNRT